MTKHNTNLLLLHTFTQARQIKALHYYFHLILDIFICEINLFLKWVLKSESPTTQYTHTQRYWLYLPAAGSCLSGHAELRRMTCLILLSRDARAGRQAREWCSQWSRVGWVRARLQTLLQAKFQTIIYGWSSLTKHRAFHFVQDLGEYNALTINIQTESSSHLQLRGAPGIQQDRFHLADLSDVSMEAWAAVTHKHTQGVGRPLRLCNAA